MTDQRTQLWHRDLQPRHAATSPFGGRAPVSWPWLLKLGHHQRQFLTQITCDWRSPSICLPLLAGRSSSGTWWAYHLPAVCPGIYAWEYQEDHGDGCQWTTVMHFAFIHSITSSQNGNWHFWGKQEIPGVKQQIPIMSSELGPSLGDSAVYMISIDVRRARRRRQGPDWTPCRNSQMSAPWYNDP